MCLNLISRIANNHTVPRGGKVTPRVFKENHGLRTAWFDAWYPKPDDEFCIIIEDDLEMSPYWFIWLKKAWAKYQDREDIAGIALQVRKKSISIIFFPVLFLETWKTLICKNIPQYNSFDVYLASFLF